MNTFESLVAANEHAVLIIVGKHNDDQTTQSSGCVLHPDGLILTTAHQVEGVEHVEGRLLDGTTIALSVIEIDAEHEIALLRADRRLPDVAIVGDVKTLRSGSPLMTIATPANLDFTVSTGIVANMNRTYRGRPVIQAEIAAAPGSSGGPVFSMEGKVVGLIMGILEEQEWATIVIPINNAYPLLRRHGILSAEMPEDMEEEELLPVSGITPIEHQALEAYNLGTRTNTLNEKKQHYARAVELLPGFYEAWFNLGVALVDMEDYTGALKAYERAMVLHPDRVETHRNLGRLHLVMGEYASARKVFAAAAALVPDEAQSYNDLGESFRKAGDYARAVEWFAKAVALDEQYAIAHYNLAIVYIQTEQWPLAQSALNEYMALATNREDRDAVQHLLQHITPHIQDE